MVGGNESSRLAGFCFLAAFFWLSHSLDRHSLLDQPRLSACLVLLVAGAFSFLLSFFSKHLPGADGRFDSDAVFKGLKSSLPQRPRRFHLPCIIILIVVRMEILYRVIYDFQCTVQGVEAFVPLLLAAFEFLFNRKPSQAVVSDEPEDPWGSVWEDFVAWVKASPILLFSSSLLFCYGVFLVADFPLRSSYYCSATSDQTSWVILLQWTGVVLDAILLIMLWRVISWTRTTKNRLRTVSAILTLSSTTAGLLWLLTRLFQHRSIPRVQSFRGLGSLYLFDVVSNGITFAVLVVSLTLWICDSTPLVLSATTTFISGTWANVHQIFLIGSYQQASSSLPIVALMAISTGFSIFTFANSMRTVVFFPRILLLVLLMFLGIVTTIFVGLQDASVSRHPIDDFIYKNRVEADRWLRHATVSTTLKLAVAEYKERHHGRDPPEKFDKWFDLAIRRKSVIIDKFDQIEKDILPFWGMKPSKIQEGFNVVKAQPDVGIIQIIDGKASHNQPSEPSHKLVLGEVVSMISSFAEHLPDMAIAINLAERPRILVPWDDVHRLTEAASKVKNRLRPKAFSRRRADDLRSPEAPRFSSSKVQLDSLQPYVSAKAFQHLHTLTCPPGSKSRAGVTWNVRDHCASCAAPHSEGQFLSRWEYSLDPCHQPDIFHLHDFYTIPHEHDLYQDLLPLFGRSKTEGFNDILIPLVRPEITEEQDTKRFGDKADILFWQGAPTAQPITHVSLHGSHRHRFIHWVSQNSTFDKHPMVLGVEAKADQQYQSKKDFKYFYEEIGMREMNKNLPMAISYTSPETCDDPNCQAVSRENFDFKATEPSLDNRYIMVLDSADGPALETLSVLRSNSVPFISTIFREWYTERLMPWTHFVPVDIRYHGFHSTLAYFVGLKGRGKLNGQDQPLESRVEDARWIAEQGRKWAEETLRREDMEIYMFRLLLEWGRVIKENRDDVFFKLEDGK